MMQSHCRVQAFGRTGRQTPCSSVTSWLDDGARKWSFPFSLCGVVHSNKKNQKASVRSISFKARCQQKPKTSKYRKRLPSDDDWTEVHSGARRQNTEREDPTANFTGWGAAKAIQTFTGNARGCGQRQVAYKGPRPSQHKPPTNSGPEKTRLL